MYEDQLYLKTKFKQNPPTNLTKAASTTRNPNKSLREPYNKPYGGKMVRRRARAREMRNSSKTNGNGYEDNVHTLELGG
jgi:hypothetical protein